MKVIEFINEYSAVIAVGVMAVGLVLYIIFKLAEIHRLEEIQDYVIKIRTITDNDAYSCYTNLRSANEQLLYISKQLTKIIKKKKKEKKNEYY